MGGAYRSGLVILAVPEESFCFPSLRALVVRVCARARARAHTHTHTHTHTRTVLSCSLSRTWTVTFASPPRPGPPGSLGCWQGAGEDPAHLV